MENQAHTAPGNTGRLLGFLASFSLPIFILILIDLQVDLGLLLS
jgi:hypothetical protein